MTPLPVPPAAREQVNYLILVLTTRCNLCCRYCYHGNPVQRRDMKPATLKRALQLAAVGTGPLHIQLTGGEPCLVPGLVEKAGRLAQTLSRPWTLGMQTNATCLNPQVIGLIRRFGLQVGVSLDGSPRMQETLRGRATECLRGLMLLEQERVPFRVTTVVSNENVGQLDRLAWLLSAFRQARGIGLDLLVTRGNAAARADRPAPAEPANLARGIQGLVKALTAINRQREVPLHLREWDLVRRMLTRTHGQRERLFCQAAMGASLAVHPDGRCFPCSQSLGDTRFATAMGETPLRLPVVSLRTTRDDCDGCPLKNRCPGDCPSRLFYNPPAVRSLACTLYQTLAEACDAGHASAAGTCSRDTFVKEKR